MRDIKIIKYSKDGKEYIKIKVSLKMKILKFLFNIKGKLSKSPCYKCPAMSCFYYHDLRNKKCKGLVVSKQIENSYI